MISMPTVAEHRAATPASFISRLTARLRLGEISTGIRSAADSISAFCSGSRMYHHQGDPALATNFANRHRTHRSREIDHGIDRGFER